MKSSSIKIIIGLGNPGLKYKKTWHNVGFIAVDEIRKKYDLGRFKKNRQLQAEITEGNVNGKKVVLAKPVTFMNNSGEAVQAVINFYKIALEDLVVIHDDIDMVLGKTRVAKDSSSGGHNGIRSIIKHLGSQNFTRIKIGVKTDLLEKMGAEKYVLNKFNAQEKKVLGEQIAATISTFDKD